MMYDTFAKLLLIFFSQNDESQCFFFSNSKLLLTLNKQNGKTCQHSYNLIQMSPLASFSISRVLKRASVNLKTRKFLVPMQPEDILIGMACPIITIPVYVCLARFSRPWIMMLPSCHCCWWTARLIAAIRLVIMANLAMTSRLHITRFRVITTLPVAIATAAWSWAIGGHLLSSPPNTINNYVIIPIFKLNRRVKPWVKIWPETVCVGVLLT